MEAMCLRLPPKNWAKKGPVLIISWISSLINNWMGMARIDREAFEVGFKGWDCPMGSIRDPWYDGFHLLAARTCAKCAFYSS